MTTIQSQLTERPRIDSTEPVNAGALEEMSPQSARQADGTMAMTTICSSSPETFELEKHLIWWLWKGFHMLTVIYGAEPCINWWYRGEKYFRWEYIEDQGSPWHRFQITDQWLDNPSSFPTLKPDFDIFGIPPRSRKQRGWYHIHRPQCTLCYPVFSTTRTPTSASDSTALHFPAEIIHQIVQSNELARTQAALVCKHWAHVCLCETWSAKPHGRAHMMELQSLVTAPGSYLRDSIKEFWNRIEVSLNSNDEPWLHLLPTTRKLLPRCADEMDYVRIVGPLGKGLSTMRSIHMYLPRRLPPSFSNTIQKLRLQKVHFRTLGDLAHTLSELGNLQQFEGEELTWAGSEPASAPLYWWKRSRSHAFSFSSPAVLLKGCTRNLDAMSLVTGARYNCIELRAVSESLAVSEDDGQVKFEMMLECFGGPSTVTYHLTLWSRWELRVIQTWSPNSSSPLDVKLNLRFYRSPSKVKHIDWKSCDQAIMDYTQAQCVVIGLYSNACFVDVEWEPMDEDSTQFITDHLSLSYAARKISFARPIDGEWDLKTREEKEKDRVVRALMKLTKAKKDEMMMQLTEMESLEEDAMKKELLTKLIEVMKTNHFTIWERYTLCWKWLLLYTRKQKTFLEWYEAQSWSVLRNILP